MKIAVICRKNQARSPLLVAFYSKFYSHIVFESFGTEAEFGDEIPPQTRKFAEKFGAKICTATTRNVRDQLMGDFVEYDFVICCDEKVYSDFKAMFPNVSCILLSSYFPTFVGQLPDPVNLDIHGFYTFMHQFVAVGLYALGKILKNDRIFDSLLIIPRHSRRIEDLILRLKLSNEWQDSYIVFDREFTLNFSTLGDWTRFSNNPLIENNAKTANLDEGVESSTHFESWNFDLPDSHRFSQKWRMHLTDLLHRKVIVVSIPLENTISGSTPPLSLAAFVDKVEIF